MDAGKRNKLVTFQALSAGRDSFGQPVQTWSDVLQTWASVQPVSGRELRAAQAVQQELSHVINIRWPGAGVGITPALRATFDGRVFDLKSVANTGERNVELSIQAVELLTQG